MALWRKRGGDAGIDAAAEAEDDALLADLAPDFFDGLIDVMAHGPLACRSRRCRGRNWR